MRREELTCWGGERCGRIEAGGYPVPGWPISARRNISTSSSFFFFWRGLIFSQIAKKTNGRHKVALAVSELIDAIILSPLWSICAQGNSYVLLAPAHHRGTWSFRKLGALVGRYHGGTDCPLDSFTCRDTLL